MKTLTGCIILMLIGSIGCSDSAPLTSSQSLERVATDASESDHNFVADSAYTLFTEGRIALGTGNDKETAIAIFKQVIENHEESLVARGAMSLLYVAYMMDPNQESFEASPSKEWRSNPDIVPYFIYMADVIRNTTLLHDYAEHIFFSNLIKANALVQAKVMGERLLNEHHPHSSEIIYSLGIVSARMGDADKTDDYYKQLRDEFADSHAAEMALITDIPPTSDYDVIRWIPGIDDIIEGKYNH